MAKIQFYVMVQLICKTYISKGFAQQSIMAWLAACTQSYVNNRGQLAIFTVTEYTKWFREIHQGALPLDPTEAQAQAPDISQIFTQGLIPNIKTATKILNVQGTYNKTPITSCSDNQVQFEDMVSKALEVEAGNINFTSTAGTLAKVQQSANQRFLPRTAGTGNTPLTSHAFFPLDQAATTEEEGFPETELFPQGSFMVTAVGRGWEHCTVKLVRYTHNQLCRMKWYIFCGFWKHPLRD
jgi:hypothetical protein